MDDALYLLIKTAAIALFFVFAPTPLLFLVVFVDSWLPATVCWGLVALFGGTTVWAFREARRLRFAEYRLRLLNGHWRALFGCLVCWQICFPVFLYDRWLVKRGRATPASAPEFLPSGLITLLVLQMACTLPAFALPSCMQSPARASEANAVTMLKQYQYAQEEYLKNGGGGEDGGYCGNFRNLYYSLNAQGEPLRFIQKDLADAFAVSPQGAPTAQGAATDPTVFRRYVFMDDPYVAQLGLRQTEFGLFAVPVRPGYHIFWIGREGVVHMALRAHPADAEHPVLPRPEDSPLHLETEVEWMTL